MSKSRRSLVRSSLQRLRELWQRRDEGRREMRRSLGSTFELLEPRLAMAITAPLPPAFPDTGAHIHPVLTLLVDGHQVVIPAGIGLTSSQAYSPHTHDFSGTLHIGEGPAGVSQTNGNTSLKDFFDVWRTVSGQQSGQNPNAIFDTDATDGTPLPRFMGQTVDSTHVLRMYVKEGNNVDQTSQLEYDSSQTIAGGLVHPETYIPRDGDQIVISYDKIAQAADSPSFDTIANQTVLAGAPTWLGINGFDPTGSLTPGSPLTYSVSVSNPSLLTATLAPSADKSLVLNVASPALEGGYGQMIFKLFDDLMPRTTQHIETLATNGELATNAKFYRIAYSGANPFVIQGGPSATTSSLGKFDDEFNTDLQFTSAGLLAMAKGADDTNDSQFFVTAGPTRFLDFQHSIFGVLTEGEAVRQAIQGSTSSGDGPPPADIVINSAAVISDSQNAALQLKAAAGASGTSNVTLTVRDAEGHTYAQTFSVTIAPDTANGAPFLKPIAPVSGVAGQPITVQLAATDAEGDPNYFDATKPASETTNYTINVDHTTGLVTLTPPANFTGTFHVSMGVRGLTQTTTIDQFDLQDVAVTVTPGAPTVDLSAASDSGSSGSDDITSASSLDFIVSGVTSGATVKLLKGSTVLATGTATGSTITLTVNNAATALGQGTSGITATQTTGTLVSPASAALNVNYDTTAPVFTSIAPASAPVGIDLNYDATTAEEGPSGLIYSLSSSAPAGATINSVSGLVTWTPTTAQAGTQTFNVIATDAAGNAATQAVNVSVEAAQMDITLKLTKPDGTALTTLTPGQDFLLHVLAKDIRATPHGAFAVYVDINFDGSKATVTGPIQYQGLYTNTKSGSTSTAGLIDEAGAFGGTSETGSAISEIFAVPMRATAAGRLVFATAPATGVGHDLLEYQGDSDSVPPAQAHFGTASIDVGVKAFDDTFSVTRGSSSNTLNVLTNDTGPTLRVISAGTGNHGGTITVGTNGANLIYTPAAGFTGTETFTYTVSDKAAGTSGAQTATATASVSVTGLVAADDAFTFAEDSGAHSLDVLANDIRDPALPSSTLTITSAAQGNKGGTVTLASDNKSLNYTPALNFQGTETFSYTISDGQHSATATVTMTITNVNDPPTATNDTLSAFKNTKATFDVLANDSSAPDPTETLTLDSITTAPQHGTATIVNGKIEYTPTSGYTGSDSFVYQIKDPSGATASATANITVQDFAPSALSGFVYFDSNNNGIKDANELAIVGITLTLTGTPTAGDTTPITRTAITADDGSYKFENLAPGTNFKITESQPAFVIDGKVKAGSQGGTTAANQISIATLAQGTTGTGNNFGEAGRQVSTISLRDFFSSTSRNNAHAAFDGTGKELWHVVSGTVWSGFTNNTFALINNSEQIKLQTTSPQSQTLTKTFDTTLPVYLSGKSGNNSLYYLPGGVSGGNVHVAPVAGADSYTTNEDSPLTINASDANGLLKNDSGTSLKAVLGAQGTKGTVSLSDTGTFTYTPNANANGTDTFTYKVSDGTSESALATVTVNIAPINDAPSFTLAGNPAASAEDGGAQSVSGFVTNISAGPSDESSQTLAFAVTVASHTGSLDFDVAPAIDSTGKLTYTAKPNTNGTATISVILTDNGSSTAPSVNASAAKTFTITVNSLNDLPVSTGSTPSPIDVLEDSVTTPTTLGLSGLNYSPGGSDESGQTLTYKVTTIPSFISVFQADGTTPVPVNTTLTLQQLQGLTYKTTANAPGLASLVWTVQDSGGGTDTLSQTLSVRVTGVNDAPVRTNGTIAPISVEEDTANDAAVTLGLTNLNYGVGGGPDEADGQTLTYTITDIPSFVHVFKSDGTTQVNINDTLTLDDLKNLKYETVANASGTGNLTWTVKDNGGTTNGGIDTLTETLGITVSPIADAPSVTNSTTNEDSQTTTGLVISRNAADDGEITNFQITGITGGTLFQHDGTTPINDNDFITFAQANAGLKFTPAANFSGNATFNVQASTSNAATGLSGSIVAATITVNPVADTPAVTGATTSQNTQTTTGLVISRNAADGAEVTHFQITGITSGALFQNDGTTPINNGDFITFAQANAGLKFTPATDFSGNATFQVQASTSNTAAGLGGSLVTATIAVSQAADAPTVSGSTTGEDSQTTTGLVISPSVANAGQITHFQITGIVHGTLFQNDGTTPINNNDFITVAQANAGLKFTPAADFFGTATFSVQASTSNAAAGLTGSLAMGTITVTPVADTPAVTDSTTNEDTQTSSGLVVTRNAADDGEVTHFQITGITGGTLFQQDGTTPINNNDFITFAQASAGLKFTPAANSTTAGSFDIQASTSNSIAGLGGNVVTATINVTPVADTPTVTASTTSEDVQTASGLVIGRNAADDGEVTHFQITGIAHGTLFQSDGTTPINDGDFITFAQANAGLKFTPAADFSGAATFQVQASLSDTAAGLGGSLATATITVNPVADTPAVTAATTDEDMQTTAGLVISPNAADGPEVTHFQITGITSGALFQNDGTTPINNGDFITFAQANAGLKFTPAADFFGNASFQIQASTSDTAAGLGGNLVTSTITVNPVADTPSVTDATTDEDTQTTDGLVISPNAADGPEVTHFQITGITSGTLFQNDGTTPINEGDFITVAEAGAGLKFTPSADFNGPASFQVQGSLSDTAAGLGGSLATAHITVNAINDAPSFSIQGNPPDVIENAGDQTIPNFASNMSPGPGDEGNQQLQFDVIITSTSAGFDFTTLPAIDAATGTLTYSVAPNVNGTASISVILRDNGDSAAPNVNVSAPQAFTITVTPAGGGEGEGAAFSPNDAALLAYLAGDQNSLEVPAANWQAAVDELMGQLA